jgi:hypothetical protein
VYAFSSNIAVNDSSFNDIATEDAMLKMVGSTLLIRNTSIFNVTTLTQQTSIYFINLSLNSIIKVTNVNYQHNNLAFALILSSEGTVDDLSMENIT